MGTNPNVESVAVDLSSGGGFEANWSSEPFRRKLRNIRFGFTPLPYESNTHTRPYVCAIVTWGVIGECAHTFACHTCLRQTKICGTSSCQSIIPLVMLHVRGIIITARNYWFKFRIVCLRLFHQCRVSRRIRGKVQLMRRRILGNTHLPILNALMRNWIRLQILMPLQTFSWTC